MYKRKARDKNILYRISEIDGRIRNFVSIIEYCIKFNENKLKKISFKLFSSSNRIGRCISQNYLKSLNFKMMDNYYQY